MWKAGAFLLARRSLETTPNRGRMWYDNSAIYLTGALFTAEDIYNNYVHNHTTYKTTRNKTANIYKPNGKFNSDRAAQFAKTSRNVKFLGIFGSAFMTAQAASKINNGYNVTAWDYSDLTVGSTATLVGSAELIGGASYTIPGFGQAVAAYAWFRLWYEIGAEHGMSTWGNRKYKPYESIIIE